MAEQGSSGQAAKPPLPPPPPPRRPRSPSSMSNNSALEWDAYADVGNEPVNQGRREFDDPQGLIRVGRSRSFDEPVERETLTHFRSLRDLPESQFKEWIRKAYTQGIGRKGLLETMVAGFSEIDRDRPPSSASATTVESTRKSKTRNLLEHYVYGFAGVDPPSSSTTTVRDENASVKSDEQEQRDEDIEQEQRDEDFEQEHETTSSDQIKYSSKATTSVKDTDGKSSSMIDLGANDSTAAPTTGSSSERHTVSDFSISSKNTSQRKSKSGSGSGSGERSNLSREWLDLGMTKSELALQKRKESSTSGERKNSGASVYLLEVHQGYEDNKSPPEKYTNEKLRNVGVQVNVRKKKEEIVSDCSSIYHSTPADNNRAAEKLPRGSKGRRRERSPPQPFAVASRKSPHHHHHAHHSRNMDTEISSLLESKTCDTRDKERETTSSSELSTMCSLINKLAKSGKGKKLSSGEEGEVVDAIAIHRDYHIKKVRHELKQLEKLNGLLCKNLDAKRAQKIRDKSSSSSSDIDVQKKPAQTQTRQSPSKRQPQPPQERRDDYASTSSSSSSSKAAREAADIERKKASLEEFTRALFKDSALPKSKEGRDSVEKKLDELMDAFTFIASMLIDKDSAPSIPSSEEEVQKQPKQTKPRSPKSPCNPPQPVKAPLAYFLPFPNCQGRYVLCTKNVYNSECDDEDNGARSGASSRNGRYSSAKEESDAENVENRDPRRRRKQSDSDQDKREALKIALQEVFEKRCPNFLNRLREREAVLARIKSERELRAEKKREWIRLYGNNCRNLADLNTILPPKGPRLMTTKEMREITRRNYDRLPEVQEKKSKRKVEEDKKTNRLMSQVFAQQLRKEARKGDVNFLHSRSLLRR